VSKPHIILISIDTLRYDHLGCYGYGRNTSPYIDKFAHKATLYKNAYSTAVWTPPAHASMLTGLYPSSHGVMGDKKLGASVPTIAQILQQNGYHTCGFVNNSQVGEMVGFEKDHSDFYEIWKGIEKHKAGKRILHKLASMFSHTDKGAKKTTDKVQSWISNRWDKKSPFYLFIHYLEPHNPLFPPKEFKNKFLSERSKGLRWKKTISKYRRNPLYHYLKEAQITAEQKDVLVDLYDAEIAYLDWQIGRLFSFLKKNNLFENTLVAVTADHGEHFGEKGHFSHVASLYEQILHVPLVIKYPYQKKANLTEHRAQLIDLLPTIVAAADLDFVDSSEYKGIDLLNILTNNDRKLYAEWEGRVPEYIRYNALKVGSKIYSFIKNKKRAVYFRDFKYIKNERGADELYNLKMDSGENYNIIYQNAEMAEKLSNDLINFSRNRRTNKEEKVEMNDEIIENLKKLGYI
jgi:arylsulfatase A-like enzyme